MIHIFPSYPIIKSKSFCPNPVAKYGIPAYADSSIKTKKVVGTPDWRAWWEEQLYYCINGYETGGIWIPGRYYYFLNFCYVSTLIRGSHHPDYVDVQLEFMYLIEQAKAERKGIIAPKSRRKGLSEMMNNAVIGHGVRFFDRYKAAVVAGLKDYADDFIGKYDYNDSLLAPELKLRRLTNNTGVIEFGWKEKDEYSGFAEHGSRNEILIRTVFNNPNVLKGLMLNDLIMEESGENDLLIETLDATKPCFMVGDEMYGTVYVYGTGNKQSKGTKQFEELWHESEAHRLLRFFIPAKRMYFPFVGGAISPETGTIYNKDGTVHACTPNLMHLKPHERIGIEDTEAAQIALEYRGLELKKLQDKSKYVNFKQNNPNDVKDVFMRHGGNNFPSEILNDQSFLLNSLGYNRYKHYFLEYVKDVNGFPVYPLQVEKIPLSDVDMMDDDLVSRSVMILDGYEPLPHYRNLDVAGLDSYDLDQSKTSKSLGAMVVFRQNHNMPKMESNLPIALVRSRPLHKEVFYENCLRLSIHFHLIGNVLIDVAKPFVIKHFQSNGGEIYLAPRPKKFEALDTTQQHPYGMAMTRHSKPLLIGILQTHFFQHTNKIYFPHIIKEALDYDEKMDDSDNDTIDALGLALARLIDMGFEAVNEKEELADDPYSLGSWKDDGSGNMINTKSIDNAKDIEDPFMRYVMTGSF